MTKLLIVLLVAIIFSGCTASKNAKHRNDNVNIVIPVPDHYSKDGYDYEESWRKLREAKHTPY
jgi:hypothetical protein